MTSWRDCKRHFAWLVPKLDGHMLELLDGLPPSGGCVREKPTSNPDSFCGGSDVSLL